MVLEQVPPVTRYWLLGSLVVTALCHLEVISFFSLFFSWHMIVQEMEVWRLFTSFFFFGNQIDINFLFYMFFIYRHSTSLEKGSFAARGADYLYMFVVGSALIMLFTVFLDVVFLGQPLSLMMVYVWSRRNPHAHMEMLGLFTFRAPYLPWILLGFSYFVHGGALVDCIGIAVGHLYFFLEDMYPKMIPSKVRLLQTPRVVERFYAAFVADAEVMPAESGELEEGAMPAFLAEMRGDTLIPDEQDDRDESPQDAGQEGLGMEADDGIQLPEPLPAQ